MASSFVGRALVDGQAQALADARIAITDGGVARGDGAFETIGVWDGRPFRLADHLQRLSGSLEALSLPPVDTQLLAHESTALLAGLDTDAALRIYITATGTRVLTLSAQPERIEPKHLASQPAPWIQPIGSYGPAGAKSMSYGPNMAATRHAQAAGADDALLCSVPDGYVLEGPTFGVVFVARGIVHAPDVALGIVDSISRRTLLEIAEQHGIDVLTGRWGLEALTAAEEVIISSSIRDAIAVEQVDEFTFGRQHPVRDLLSSELWRRRRP